MSRTLTFALFITISTSILAGMHYYLWLRLVRSPAVPAAGRIWMTAILIALGLSVPAAIWVRHAVSPAVTRPLAYVAFLWLGTSFILMVSLAATELVRIGQHVVVRTPQGEALASRPRRVFLSRALATAAAGVGFTLAGASAYAARTRVGVKRLQVALSRLPAELDGFRIVQITDLHMGPTLGRGWLEAVIAQVNGLRPDLVAVTGDLVDGSVEDLRGEVEPLGRLSAPQGAYFVTGNHEYYSGAEPWIAQIGSLGLRVLRNERVSIGRGGDASFDLAGIDDHSAFIPGHGPDLARAVAGRDERRELILLAHQPKAADEAERHGVGLQLSGHTHGGQIWPWHYAVYLQQPYLKGLHRQGRTQVYVSEGTGFWGPPMRLGSACEITEITLRTEALI